MGIHLTVVSYPSTLHPMFEAVASRANNQLPDHQFVRCQRREGLHGAIMKAAPIRNLRADVSCLDLVGHGSAGYFELGDEPLASGSRISRELSELKAILPSTATVRLLGCLTGSQDKGLTLLEAVSGELALEVVVPLDVLTPDHFGQTGLKDNFAPLLSSQTAGVGRQALRTAARAVPVPPQAVIDAAASWVPRLPAGYEVIKRAHAAAVVDFRMYYEGVKVTFACDCQLVLVDDQPGQAPLLFRWSSPKPVPLAELLTPRSGWKMDVKG